MRIGILQLICCAAGVFLIALGGGIIGGRLAAGRVPPPAYEKPAEPAVKAESSPDTNVPEDFPAPPAKPEPDKEISSGPASVSEEVERVAPPENLPKPPPVHPKQTLKVLDAEIPAVKEPYKSASKNYAIQVLSTQSSNDARAVESKIRGKGFPARIFEVDLEDKGKWYRVYVGPYESETEAAMVLRDIRRIPGFQNSFVKLLEPGKDFIVPIERKELKE